jgi:hypothetical protein
VNSIVCRLAALFVMMTAGALSFAQQIADPDFDASVKVKTYGAKEHPRVAIDEAHHNFHTMEGRYKPLADLLTNDGYEVLANKEKFQPQTLRSLRVLIVANAEDEAEGEETSGPAFTDAECDIVRDWVSDGGALLLVADHTPFGSAAASLARQFGVSMGKGFAFDVVNFETSPSNVVFRDKGLGDHPILRGRNPNERIRKVVAFTGQSLSVPGIGVPLLKFGPTSHESENRSELQLALEAARAPGATPTALRHATPAAGRAQGLALMFGKGRVVILGEAALLTAQISKSTEPSSPDQKFGMNTPGNDDRQFALNILHWLSSAL